MRRWSMITAGVAVLLALSGGCPWSSTDDSTDSITLSTTAPTEIEVGDTATMKVTLPDDVETSKLIIQWFQTFGRVVELTNSDTVEASFVAPSLEEDQTFTFRVDVETTAGKVFSKAVTVIIKADPDYVAPDAADEDELYPVVRIETSEGTITVKLNRAKAPLTVNNFLRYVDDGFYDDTLIHRVVADFVIQGGGYDEDLELKETRPAILSEADNGLSNVIGTIAMAHTGEPDTATSQWFINLADNLSLDYDNPDTDELDDGDKHTVFGEVIDGMDVVEAIGEVDTETRDSMDDVPEDDIIVTSITRVTTSDDDEEDDSVSSSS